MRPTLVLFDVNETLSDLERLRARFEEAGAPVHPLETWFASTMRDGFALAAAGAYADFRKVALDVLRGQLERIDTLRRDPEKAAEHIIAGFDDLDVIANGMRRLADAVRNVPACKQRGSTGARRPTPPSSSRRTRQRPAWARLPRRTRA